MASFSLFLFLLGLFHLGSSQCPEKNGLFPVPGRCDAYIECRNGTAKEEECPDGLVFNDKLTHLRYPCNYPFEVECGNSRSLKAADPRPHCPRKWGLFADEDPKKCGNFWNCVEGRAFQFNCPEGLAFSAETGRCEYPDETTACNAEEFLGFTCPEADPLQVSVFLDKPRFKHPTDCRRFYVCFQGNKPRLQVCQQDRVYNAETLGCEEPATVPGCENYYKN